MLRGKGGDTKNAPGPSADSWGIWRKGPERFVMRFLHFSISLKLFQNKKLGENSGCEQLVVGKGIDYKGAPGNFLE